MVNPRGVNYTQRKRPLNMSRMRIFLNCLLTCFLLLDASVSLGITRINIHDAEMNSGLNVARQVEYTSEAACLDAEAGQLLSCGIWRKNSGSSINFGFQQIAYAFRLTLENTSDEAHPIYLEIGYPLLDDIELWHFQESGFELNKGQNRLLLTHQRTGDEARFNDRGYQIPEYLFPLQIPPGESQVLLRVHTTSSMQLPIRLWHIEPYLKEQKIRSLFQGALMGGVAILLFYNLFLFFSLRETSYLYFALTLLGYLGVEGILNGALFAYVWPEQVAWNRIALVPISNLALLCLVLFTHSFLNVGLAGVWIAKVLRLLMVACLGVIALTLFFEYQPLIRVTAALVIAVPVLCYIAGFVVWRAGQRSALFFLIAFTTFVLFACIFVLNKYGFLVANVITENAIHAGTVITALLLSFALANRVREERSARARAQKTAIASLEKFQTFYDQSLAGLFRIDMDGRLLSCNPAFARLLRMGVTPPVGQMRESQSVALELFNEENRSGFIFTEKKDWDSVRNALENGGQITQFVALCNDVEHREFWGEFSFRRVQEEGSLVCDGSVIDITTRKQNEMALQFLARHDSLTGLLNREELEKRITQALADEDSHYVVFFIDLDRFKIVNDSCGHLAGDELLKKLALLFRSVVGNKAAIARFGGDEFAMLIPRGDADEIHQLAEDLRLQTSAFRFDWQAQHFSVSLSIGVVHIDASFEDALDVLNCADEACYKAKHGGRNQVFVYSKKQQLNESMGYTSMVSYINEALEENGFRLYYQPIVDLGKDEPGQRYELLLRMRKDRQTLPTGAFLPVAQRYNLMPLIDQWVIRTYFGWLRDHPEEAQQLVMANINIDAQSMAEPGTLALIQQLVHELPVEPARVCFEITESAALASMDQTIDFINALKRYGFQFAIDDFGRGYATYAYLKKLPVDFVKIDGSFVVNIETDRVNKTIVGSITDVAHAMGMKVVAEFVENVSILGPLREMQLDYGQGYYFSKPAPLDMSADSV